MTNHAYFNLDGYDSGAIHNQVLWIDADTMNEYDADMIPTGKILPVQGTPYDYTTPKAIGKDFDSDPETEKQAGGYDNNYIFNDYDGQLRLRASLYSPASGIEAGTYQSAMHRHLYGKHAEPELCTIYKIATRTIALG